ncbi:MAG: hypothetical protein ACJASU_002242 [Cognaticolwellia sp.]|jgi:hypothetical protein
MCWLKSIKVLAQLKTIIGLTEALDYTDLAASEDELDDFQYSMGRERLRLCF